MNIKYRVNFKVGIYKFVNNANGKFYIGSTVVGKDRWYGHKSALRANRHHNKHLQRAWNKYGEKSFKFQVIEKLDEHINEDQIIPYEQKWLDLFFEQCPNLLYNMCRIADRGPGMRGKKHSEKTKKKISKTKKGVKLGPQTEEHKRKVSLAHKGKKWTKQQRLKQLKVKGIPIVQMNKEGLGLKIFMSTAEAVESLKTGKKTGITLCCRKERQGITSRTTGGYRWMYLKDFEKNGGVFC